LVTFGSTPARASDELIGLLHSHCQVPSPAKQLFEPGERVTITDGAFAGFEAIYQMRDGESRVMVLIDIMSKSARLALPPGSIRKH
jgi:transcriptional antiterminator RfaH